MQWGHPGNLIGGCLLMVAIAMIWGSAWLKGRGWFIATVSVLGLGLIALEWDIGRSTSAVPILLEAAGISLGFATFFYFVAGRYITRTSVTDMTFQSHDSLAKFIDESGDTSLLARVLRHAGPWLLAAFLTYGAFVALAKYSGAIE